MFRFSGWVAWVFLVVLWSARVSAQSADDEAARTHFDSGHLHFDRGDYETALTEFEAAYELSHRPALLYNLYLTLERLNRLGDAADRLEQYLHDEAAIDPEQRPILETRLVNLREREREAEVVAAPVSPPPSGGLGGLGVAGVTTLGVGAASLIVFAITGGLAAAEDGSVGSRCGESAGRTCTEADVATLRTLDTTADVTLTIGLVLAAAGATMLAIDLVSGQPASGTEHARLAPMVSPQVIGLQVGGVL